MTAGSGGSGGRREGAADAGGRTFLFVYGTLRSDSGHPMAELLRRRGRLLGLASAPGRRVELADYPGLLPALGAEDRVRGELHELLDPDLLPELDRYEGCEDQPPEYLRRELEVRMEDGERRTAWAYVYQGPFPS